MAMLWVLPGVNHGRPLQMHSKLTVLKGKPPFCLPADHPHWVPLAFILGNIFSLSLKLSQKAITSILNHHSPCASCWKCPWHLMLALFSQIISLHVYWKVKPMLIAIALLYPGQVHLELECHCFPFCFFLFYFVSVFTWSIPSRLRRQTFSLLTFLTADSDSGEGAGWERGSESIFSTKIISFPQHVQQLQREFDIWGDWVAREVLIYLAVGKQGIGSSKSAAGVSGWGFRGRRKYSQLTQ